MQASDRSRAVQAAVATASSLGLPVDDATVLHDSNTLSVRLLPCDVVARVAPAADQVAQFEVGVAGRLARLGSPVAALEPRVEARPYQLDGFVVTLWTSYEPASPAEVDPADYADASWRLHAGMRELDVATPHVTDRVAHARRLVADRDQTPALADHDRALLGSTSEELALRMCKHRGADQVLHGEPHPGNVLTAEDGLRSIDVETRCRGPVEFDLAHAPEEVSQHYPGIDRGLLDECRILVLAMITAWRWDRRDQLPRGRQLGASWLDELRTAVARNASKPRT